MTGNARVTILDVTDDSSFARIPACADPGFDHRSCDYWEDADRGSKAARLSWLQPSVPSPKAPPPAASTNPFLADLAERPAVAFGPLGSSGQAVNPFLIDDDAGGMDNPFAPRRAEGPAVPDSAPRKLQLLGRGLRVAGSYAKVLLDDETPAVYCQFGPLSAYPRAQRTRELYPALPDAPLPAVITCIATTAGARHRGLAQRLVSVVCDDLAERGFAAVETYPELAASADATSAATPAFWEALGFVRAVDDERFPVMRRELA